MMATKLSSAFVAPSKVANILDWRKAVGVVMGLDITRERIGIAVAEHPDLACHDGLEPFPLNSLSLLQDRSAATGEKNRLNADTVSELEAAVRQHRVCAFVVNWPIHEGRTGEQCGRVLRVLDSIVDQSNSVVTTKRPFALWCDRASASFDSSPPDKWGRSADFTRLPDYSPGMRYSSKSEIVRESAADASANAAEVLDEWVKNHWVITDMGRAKAAPTKEKRDLFFCTHSVDEYTNEKAALQAALL